MHSKEKLGFLKNQSALQNEMFWIFLFENFSVFSGTFNSNKSILTLKPQNI